jgi:hypothetical protein
MWKPWNSRKEQLERLRMVFREYVMADLAGLPGMKMSAIEKLVDMKEMPRPAIRDMGINSAFFNTVPSIPFQRVVDAWANWRKAVK